MKECKLEKIKGAYITSLLENILDSDWFVRLDEDQNGQSFTILNKLSILLDILQSHPELRTEIDQITNKIIGKRSTKTPDKIKLFENPEDNDKFKISIYTPSAFIPGLSGELSGRLYKELEADFQRCILFDGEDGLILSSEDLNKALNNYKQRLINILKSEYGRNIPMYTLIDSEYSDELIYKFHEELMRNTARALNNYIYTERNGMVNERMESGLRNRFFKYLKAFVALLNFDDLVEHMTLGAVFINASHKGDFLYHDTDKYRLKEDTIYEHSFADGNMESNGDHTTPNILKIAFGQIPISDAGDHLTSSDLRQIIEYINHSYHDELLDTTETYAGSRDSEFDNYYTLFNSRNFDEQWNALMNILRSRRFISKFKETKANAVREWFSDYKEKYTRNRPDNLSDFEEFENKRNLMTALIHTITSQRNAVFIATSDSGNKVNTSVDRSTSKKLIYDAIKGRARENYLRGKKYVYDASWQINPGKSVRAIDDIFSQSARRNLTTILGLTFGQDMLEVIAKDNNLEFLGEALSEIQQAFKMYLGDPNLSGEQLESRLNSFIEYLKILDACVGFTNILVELQSGQIKKVYDQNNNTLPGESIYATLTDFERNKSEFVKHFRSTGNGTDVSTGNILCTHPELTRIRKQNSGRKNGFISHVCFRSDVMIKDPKGNGLITGHVLLEPDELMTVGLGYDWFKSILDDNQFILQTETYSDKPRVVLHAYNFAEDGGIQAFYEHDIEVLKDMWKQQYVSYYTAVQADICNNWSKIAGVQFNNFTELLNWLKNNKITEKELHNKVKELQASGDTTNFIESYDYIINKDGSISLNNSLVYKVAQMNNLDEEYQLGLDSFIKDLKESGNIPLRGFEGYENWDAMKKQKAAAILGINPNSLKSFIDSKSWNVKDANGNLVHEKILEKYFATKILLADADLQLGIRFPWLHIAKKNSNLTHDELIKVLSGDKTNLAKIRKEDLSTRLVAGKKRNSGGVATYTPQAQGLRFGVPNRMKVVMAKFPKEVVENHFGIRDEMKPHDGASFVSGIYSIFEEASYPGHEFLGTRKTIGLIPHFGSFTQVKHAENTLTNELMRGMATRNSSKEFNAESLSRLAYEGCKLNDRFIYNWRTYKSDFEFDKPSFSFNGRIATLQDIQINDSGEFLFTWTYDDSGEEVPRELINQMIGAPVNPQSGFVQIDNLYQLWNAFGGINSMSPNKYGRKTLSEISNRICAQLISIYDVSSNKFRAKDTTYINEVIPMKEQIVAKIIDPESCKSGQIMVNSAEQLRSGDVTFGWLDTARWGIQQDYTHESLDAKIPALTQVITAIAFNGNNIELVSNLYDALGSLISKSLAPLIKKTENPKELNIYLAKKLQRSLQKNSIASSAMELVNSFLEEILNDKEAPAVFCYSNKDVFYKVSSDLVSNLNKDTIKQQFDGIPVIQCPSQGIVMLFEDHDGNMYTRTDLVKKAKEEVVIPDQSHLYTDDEYLDLLFTTTEFGTRFGDIEITPDNVDIINIGDHLIPEKIISENIFEGDILIDSAGKEIKVSKSNINSIKKSIESGDQYSFKSDLVLIDPQRLRIIIKDINSGAKYTKKYSVQRDLGVSKITWTESKLSDINASDVLLGQRLLKNGTEQLIVTTQNIESIKNDTTGKYQLIEKGTEKNNMFALNSVEELLLATEENKLLYKKWHRANIAGIASSNPYYYRTIDDFIAKKLTPIYDVNKRSGLQVIPKKYTKFLEQDYSLAEIREQGYKFFYNHAKSRYSIDTILKDGEYGLALTDGEIICTTSEVSDSDVNTIIDYDGAENKWYIKDVYGNKLLEIPGAFTKVNDVYQDVTSQIFKANIQTNENGKTILTISIKEGFEHRFNALRSILDRKHAINAVYKGSKQKDTPNLLQPQMSTGLRSDMSFDQNIDLVARQMYTSWEASHQTISARIPSQSFQSFLSTLTVAYTENTDYNLGYMNIWEMWFQGSDFDIDKAYTLMYSLDRQGKIAGNIFTDYTDVNCIVESLNLPISKYGKIEEGMLDEQLVSDINSELGTDFANIDAIVEFINNTHHSGKYPVIRKCIEKLNEYSENGKIQIGFVSEGFKQLFNRYNNEGTNSTKNRIVQGIFSLSQDLRNLEASEQPMDMAPVTGPIKSIREKSGYDDNLEYNEYNPYTLFKIQRANSIGKVDVGISANGIKGAGALQQYFNQLFTEDISEFDSRIDPATGQELPNARYFADGKINLQFNVGDRLILDQSFCRLANTRISKNKYRKLWDKAHVDPKSKQITEEVDPEYILFLYLKDPVRAKMRYPQSSKLARYLENNSENLTYRERKLKLIYKSYELEFGKAPDSLFDLSYYGINFEDNVADYISVFISMSTDNAKELALAKIHGTPELLSIPLAMITLGVDIDSVVDVCVNILDKVHDELAQNRFNNAGKKDILGIIKALAVPTKTRPAIIDKATSDSLVKIYNFAQELRSITAFFKVNQGVTTKYSELKSFITTLANDRLTKAENKFGKIARKNRKVLTPDEWNALEIPVDFNSLFTDQNYADKITAEYNLSKTVVNVMDVVQTSPHFSEQLRSTAHIVKLLEDISGKAWISERLLGTQVEVDDEGNISQVNTDENKLDISKFRTADELSKIHARVLRLVDSWVITQFLKSNELLRFSISELTKSYPNSVVSSYGAHDFLRLDSEFGINAFVEFVNNTIIPELRDRFPGNFFLESLESKSLNKSDIIYYDLKFDPYAVKDNPTLGSNFNSAQAEFDMIKNIPLDIRTMNGENLTIGELFYLYGTITGRGLTTGLNTIAHSVNLNPKIIQITTDDLYTKLDELSLNKDYDALDRIVLELIPYSKAIANDGSTTINIGEASYHLDINNGFISTAIKPEILNVRIDTNSIKNAIELMCPFVTATVSISERPEKSGNRRIEREVRASLVITSLDGTKSYVIPERVIYTFSESGRNKQTYVSNSEMREILQETVLAANDAFIYVFGDSINDLFSGSLLNENEDYIPEIRTVLSDFSEENIGKSISDWLKSEHQIIFTTEGPSRVRTIGQNQILIINKNDFVLPSTTDEKYNQSKKNIKHRLIDMYFESLSSSNFTQIGKLISALQFMYPGELVDENNVYNVIKSHLSDISKNVLGDYIDQLRTDTQRTDQIKRLVRNKLFEFQYQYLNPDYYWEYADPEKNNMTPGDLITDETGEYYLYVGPTPKSDGFIIVPVGDVTLESDLLRIINSEELKDYTLTAKLTSNSDMYIGQISKSNFQYELEKSDQKIENLNSGDLVEINGSEFIVVETHLNFIDDFGPKADKKFIHKLLLINTSNGDQLILKKNNTTGEFENQYNSSVGTTLPTIKVKRANRSSNKENSTIYNFNEMSQLSKRFILDQLFNGDKIKLNSGEELSFKRKLNDNFISTLEGRTINISEISEILSSINLIDPEVERITSSRSYYILDKSLDADHPMPITWAPELSEGFIRQHAKNPNSWKTAESWLLITPVKTAIENNEYVEYPKTYLDGYYKVKDGKLEVDDIIYEEHYDPESKTSYVQITKVIAKEGDKVDVLIKRITLLNRVERIETNIKRVDSSTYSKSNVYSKKLGRFKSNQSPNKISLSARSLIFLEMIKKKTKMNINFVESSEDFIARVNGNIIEINESKVENESDIVKEAAHEFTHIVLANLRAQSPTVYAELIDRIIRSSDFATFNVSNVYTDNVQKAEEFIVRKITESAKNYLDSSSRTIELDEILNIMYAQISSFFGVRITGNNINTSIDELLKDKDYFKDLMSYLDLNTIRQGNIKSEIIDQIKKECN